MSAVRSNRTGEKGQAVVLFALVMTVLLGFAALALDVGLLRKTNQDLWNALDAGALSGVQLLPDKGTEAEKVARQYIQENFPGTLPDADVKVSFRCLIGSVSGSPRLSDVPLACDPRTSVSWTCNAKVCTAPCDPAVGMCNVIVVSSPATRDYFIGPAVGHDSGTVGTRTSAACKGWCGNPPNVPIDIVIVLDRSSSMSGVDTENARNAADSVRKAYDPSFHYFGFSVLGPSKSTSSCLTQADTVIGTANTADLRRWVPVALSGRGATANNEDYLASTSKLAKAIACFGNSSTGTDIADPVRMAIYELETNGRKGAKKAILLMSDGKPNRSTTGTTRYCEDAYNAATAAKSKGIEFFAVGFGLDGSGNERCDDPSGPWYGKYNRQLLAAMATSSTDGGCPGTSNTDGDHFYCVPKTSGASTDLSKVFQQAINSMMARSHLVKLP
jgi:hypothetical protein